MVSAVLFAFFVFLCTLLCFFPSPNSLLELPSSPPSLPFPQPCVVSPAGGGLIGVIAIVIVIYTPDAEEEF